MLVFVGLYFIRFEYIYLKRQTQGMSTLIVGRTIIQYYHLSRLSAIVSWWYEHIVASCCRRLFYVCFFKPIFSPYHYWKNIIINIIISILNVSPRPCLRILVPIKHTLKKEKEKQLFILFLQTSFQANQILIFYI